MNLAIKDVTFFLAIHPSFPQTDGEALWGRLLSFIYINHRVWMQQHLQSGILWNVIVDSFSQYVCVYNIKNMINSSSVRIVYMRTLLPEAGISGKDKLMHPTEYCGMQLLITAWDICFLHQSPYIWNGNCAIPVPANVVAANDTKPSASTAINMFWC